MIPQSHSYFYQIFIKFQPEGGGRTIRHQYGNSKGIYEAVLGYEPTPAEEPDTDRWGITKISMKLIIWVNVSIKYIWYELV